jgi:hypothetical protein
MVLPEAAEGPFPVREEPGGKNFNQLNDTNTESGKANDRPAQCNLLDPPTPDERVPSSFPASVIFPDSCKFSGINDRLAIVGRTVAPLYFETLAAYMNSTRAVEVYRYGYENHAKFGENPPQGWVEIEEGGIGIDTERGGAAGGDGGEKEGGSTARELKAGDRVEVEIPKDYNELCTELCMQKEPGKWYRGRISKGDMAYMVENDEYEIVFDDKSEAVGIRLKRIRLIDDVGKIKVLKPRK